MAEGGGLLNRYTLQRRIEGSNPSVSARSEIAVPNHFLACSTEINPCAGRAAHPLPRGGEIAPENPHLTGAVTFLTTKNCMSFFFISH